MPDGLQCRSSILFQSKHNNAKIQIKKRCDTDELRLLATFKFTAALFQ